MVNGKMELGSKVAMHADLRYKCCSTLKLAIAAAIFSFLKF